MDINTYINARKKENEAKAEADKRSLWQRIKDTVNFDIKNIKDVLTGKKSLLQALKDRNKFTHKEMMNNNKSYRDAASVLQGAKDAVKDKINQKVAKNEVLTRLKDNIKEGIRDKKEANEMDHKYDMSSAFKSKVNGKDVYLGVREKPSYWQRLKNVMTGKKTVYAAIRNNVKDVRTADAVVHGTYSGIRKTLHELRVAKPGQYDYESGGSNKQNEKSEQNLARIVAMRGGVSADKMQVREVQVHDDLYHALETYARASVMEEMSGISGFSYNGMDKNKSLDILKKASPEELKQAIGQFKSSTEKNPIGNADFSARVVSAAEKLPEQLETERKGRTNVARSGGTISQDANGNVAMRITMARNLNANTDR